MAAPTRVSSSASAFNTSTTPKTVSGVSVQAGDLVVVSAGSENGNSTASDPTSTGYTFTLAGTAGSGGSECEANTWYATAPSTATISVTNTVAGGGQWGMEVTVWRNHGGVGNVFAADSNTTTSAPSGALTTTGANSAVDCVVADWNASATAPTYRNLGDTPVQDAGAVSGGAYSIYAWHNPDAGAAGAKTIGLTAPTMRWAMVAVEILAATSGTQYAASGAVISTSATTATVRLRAAVAAAVAVASVASGTATALRPSSGTVPATSTAAGAPTARLVTSGAVASTSATTGNVTSLLPASGSVASTSAAAGSAALESGAQTYPASGTVATTSAVTGAVTSLLTAAGATAATSTTTGAAGLLPGGSLVAQGSAVSVSLATGIIQLRAAAAGAVVCSSTTTGDPAARLVAAGSASSSSTAAGSIAASLVASGSATATSTITGSAGIYDPSIPPLPTTGVSLTVSTGTRGLTVTTEARSLEVST